MEEKTENLKRAFDYIRTFYNEVAQLLSDIMDLMSKKGWDPPAGAITDGLSYSLEYPDQWMCNYIYKNFVNKEIDTHIKGVVIFFDEHMTSFPVSIVCGKIKESANSYNKWGIYYLALNNKEELEHLTGEVFSLSTEHAGKTVTGDIFAIPLSTIESPEDVKERIVKKLLEL